MDLDNLRYLIVGAGFSGAVLAERIAADLGERVLVIDRRNHIGGNSWSADDPSTGIECHLYGSHIFHTSEVKVSDYVGRFCTLNHYRHRVLTSLRGCVYQMPVNLATICAFFGRTLSPEEARQLVAEEARRDHIEAPANLEEKAISLVGRRLYGAFIEGYTKKHWETHPRELPPEVITRLPLRFGYKSDYFDDTWQGIPNDGYAALFARLLGHPRIEVRLGTDFFAIRDRIPRDCTVIYTGPIDRYYDYRFGELGWLTLSFEKEVVGVGDFQGTAVMNYAEAEVPYTRIHEFRHYHEDRPYPDNRTVIFREFSSRGGVGSDPYYPVATPQDRDILALYQAQAAQERNVVFAGRLGTYRYLDMDDAIAEALAVYETRIRIRSEKQ